MSFSGSSNDPPRVRRVQLRLSVRKGTVGSGHSGQQPRRALGKAVLATYSGRERHLREKPARSCVPRAALMTGLVTASQELAGVGLTGGADRSMV